MINALRTSFMVGALISVPYLLFALFVYGQVNLIAFGTSFLIGFAVSFSPREAFAKPDRQIEKFED